MLSFVRNYGIEKSRKMGLYRCDCGGKIITRIDSVRDNLTKSCGCLRVANMNKINARRVK